MIPLQVRVECNSNEEVNHIPQISKAEASPTDYLLSYPGYSLDTISVFYSPNWLGLIDYKNEWVLRNGGYIYIFLKKQK